MAPVFVSDNPAEETPWQVPSFIHELGLGSFLPHPVLGNGLYLVVSQENQRLMNLASSRDLEQPQAREITPKATWPGCPPFPTLWPYFSPDCFFL